MPAYEYACEHGYATERMCEMGQAPSHVKITHHVDIAGFDDADGDAGTYLMNCTAQRVYSFQYQEDRRHMRSGISHATGERYAQSRTEERIIEKTKGIEFVSRSEMPKQWTKLSEYARHVKAGGERISPHQINPSEVSSTKGDLLRKMSERGIRLGA